MDNNFNFDTQNKEENYNKKNDKNKTFIFGIIIIILLCIIGYLSLGTNNNQNNIISDKKDNNNNQNSSSNDYKDLDVNSGIALTLFDYVDVDMDFMDWKSESNKTVTLDDLSYNDRFKIAIDGLVSNTSIRCSKIHGEISASFKNNENAEVLCGNSNKSDALNLETRQWNFDNNDSAFAITYKEDKIKQRMHTIFGGNYYTRKEVIDDGAKEYHYIDSINSYVVVDVPKGGTRDTVKETLVSAQKNDEAIVLFVAATSTNNKTRYSYKYTFKYNKNDSSYYFYSLEIKDN